MHIFSEYKQTPVYEKRSDDIISDMYNGYWEKLGIWITIHKILQPRMIIFRFVVISNNKWLTFIRYSSWQ